MPRHLETTTQSYKIAGSFTISRGAKTQADVVVCTIRDGMFAGRGECVPYKRYGETLESVRAEIEKIAAAVASGVDRHRLMEIMPAGAARNAVDCALWDLEAKASGVAVAQTLRIVEPHSLVTAYTISLGEPEIMAEQTRKNADRALLKVKVGTPDDASRIRAVRSAAPDARIILDANEGWDETNLDYHLKVAAECAVALIEQPLPAGRDAILANIDHPMLICADESVHKTSDLNALRDRYDAVNIKLDKTGGLTEALAMKALAQELDYRIMVGCMVGSSLAMAPAILLAQDVDFVDLDGPLLLAEDCEPPLRYEGSMVFPPDRALWG
ncbi:N-acetyl-D-Glu racemase DgcA [Rhizobium alvei]|uniref:Dipeptide epimerase n=1 Tax=Rhizobium alvei TaxID=1132659 RepID=A0ABT8YJV8_9HYPH|nr:N-acetyl-D-Glu racemase DgcA [Rhizobium alvei]MDO6963935.1 dipeptide epimerase [Rhizobium alvei]